MNGDLSARGSERQAVKAKADGDAAGLLKEDDVACTRASTVDALEAYSFGCSYCRSKHAEARPQGRLPPPGEGLRNAPLLEPPADRLAAQRIRSDRPVHEDQRVV